MSSSITLHFILRVRAVRVCVFLIDSDPSVCASSALMQMMWSSGVQSSDPEHLFLIYDTFISILKYSCFPRILCLSSSADRVFEQKWKRVFS